MRLPKDILSGNYTCPRFFLCETNKDRICQLEVSQPKGVFKLNSYSELQFEVGRIYNDLITGEQKINPYYDKIEAIRLIEVEGFGYFELQGPELVSDGIKEAKSCTAYSLEYTLSQKYLDDFYINTGRVDSVEVMYADEYADGNIVPVTLYNPNNKNLSLLHLILEKDYGAWKIGHVDSSLQKLSRQFEIDRSSIYDFLINEICNKFNCYVVFDTIDNTINLYAESLTSRFIADGVTNSFVISPPFDEIGTVAIDGYKTTQWTYDSTTGILLFDNFPSSGSHIEVIDGALTAWETDVFITFDNLSQEVNVSYDADAIKTCLTITYGDGHDIREANLGLPYLTDLSYYCTVDWMGQDLYDAYVTYQQKCNSYQLQYTNNAQEMLDWANRIDFEENRLSTQYSVAQSVTSETVGKYYVRGGTLPNYYYTEVSLPSQYTANTTYYSINTANLNETKVSNLFTALKKHFNAEEDWESELSALSGDFQFMEFYTISYLVRALKNDTVEGEKEKAISNFLGEMWDEVGRTPLKSLYYEPYKKIQLTNVEAGWSQKTHSNYGYYYPVVLFLDSIGAAITKREKLIREYTEQYNAILNRNLKISNELLMSRNFTTDQLVRLNSFLREDELLLNDIIETSQDTIADSFKIKQDAMESGRVELRKLSQPRLQFSMSMANIYALPEFEPIIDQFQLGNVVKVGLRPDYIMQSRLLQVDINFEDFSDFSCEFGELTTLRTQSDIHADLLSQAISAGKSVANNANYWTKGSDQSGEIQQKIDAGFLDAITSIKAMDGTQGVEIDKYGIHLNDIDPVTGEIDPKQGWITNNKFLYSDDGFKSTKSVFGEFTYDGVTYYGILAEAIVGSLIIGTQMEIGNSTGTLKFDENGLYVTNGGTSLTINPNSSGLLDLSNGTDDLFYVDEDGKLHVIGDGNGLDISLNTTVSEISQTTEQIKLSVKEETQRAVSAENGLQKSIDTASAQIALNKDNITLEVNRATAREDALQKEINEANTKITQTADEILLEANKNLSTTIEDYSTTKQMHAAIDLKADQITSTVSETLKDYSSTTEMKSEIKQEADKITSTVSEQINGVTERVSEVEQTAAGITSTVTQLSSHVQFFGTCSTAADAQTKEVNCSSFKNLERGTTIAVKFSKANTAAAPMLVINNGETTTDAKYIRAYGNYNTSWKSDSPYNWSANSTVIFVYDASYWRIADAGVLNKFVECSTRIDQTAEAITLEAERAQEAEAALQLTATQISTTVTNNKTDLQSKITQNANNISAEVKRAQGVEDSLSSRITMNENSISSKVSSGDLGTLIQQSANDVRIAWNNNSKYIKFESASLNIYNSSEKLLMGLNSGGMQLYNSSQKLIMSLTDSGSWYYANGTSIGKIGTATWSGTSYQGLVFNLETSTKFMSWAHRKKSSDSTFTSLFAYFPTADLDLEKGFHFDDNVVFNSTIYTNNYCPISCLAPIYMNGYVIYDSQFASSSDVRLKSNIQNTSVNALEVINQIEMKEFDWIETGSHESLGMIAQQLQTIEPRFVHEDTSTGKLYIETTKFIPYLIKAVQELSSYIMVAPMSISDTDLPVGWIDSYTDEEKAAFVEANKTKKTLKTQKIMHD